MNRGAMRREVRRFLGEPVADLWSDAEINDWLNEGAVLMCAESESLQAFYKKQTTANQQEYELPKNCDTVYSVKYFVSDLYDLIQTDATSQIGDRTSGKPSHYYLRQYVNQTAGQASDGNLTLTDLGDSPNDTGSVIGFIDTPSASTHYFIVLYFAKHYLMTADADVPVIPYEFRRGIIAYATAMGKMKEEAYGEANDIYLPMFESFKNKLKRKMTHRGITQFPKTKIVDETRRSGSSWIQIPDTI